MFLSLIAGFPSHGNVSSAADSQINHLTDFFFFSLSHLGSSCKLPLSSARGLAGGLRNEEWCLLQCVLAMSPQTCRGGVPSITTSSDNHSFPSFICAWRESSSFIKLTPFLLDAASPAAVISAHLCNFLNKKNHCEPEH